MDDDGTFFFFFALFDLARGSPLAFYITITIATSCSVGVYRWHASVNHDRRSMEPLVLALCTVLWPIAMAFGVSIAMIAVFAWPWHRWTTRHDRRAEREAAEHAQRAQAHR